MSTMHGTIYNIARVCHEANRAYCLSLGDDSQPHWEMAPTWQRESAMRGVENIMSGKHSPRESHESWLKQKQEEGWQYGLVKDQLARTHPCMVEYDQLPEDQKMKDVLFVAVARALLGC